MINLNGIDEFMVKELTKRHSRIELAKMVVDLNNEVMRLESDLETLRYLNLKLYASQTVEVHKQTT